MSTAVRPAKPPQVFRMKVFELNMRFSHSSLKASSGFAYLSLLIFLALLGFVSAMALQVGGLVHRRAAEEALLNIGFEYAKALSSYADQTPAGMEDQPMDLQELLLDKRLPGRVRHLRQLYPDPVKGSNEWGLKLDPETGRITGIFSLSNQTPIKISNFPFWFNSFNGKSKLSDWEFNAVIFLNKERGDDGRNGKFINPRTLIDRSKLSATVPIHQNNELIPLVEEGKQ
jgi:type II secretory pathway pseudopilin PulG